MAFSSTYRSDSNLTSRENPRLTSSAARTASLALKSRSLSEFRAESLVEVSVASDADGSCKPLEAESSGGSELVPEFRLQARIIATPQTDCQLAAR